MRPPQDKKINGITDLRDESDRPRGRGRLKKDAGQVVLNQLYKHTPLETNFGVIMLTLVNNIPRVLTLSEVAEYVKHQKEVVTRRTGSSWAK